MSKGRYVNGVWRSWKSLKDASYKAKRSRGRGGPVGGPGGAGRGFSAGARSRAAFATRVAQKEESLKSAERNPEGFRYHAKLRYGEQRAAIVRAAVNAGETLRKLVLWKDWPDAVSSDFDPVDAYGTVEAVLGACAKALDEAFGADSFGDSVRHGSMVEKDADVDNRDNGRVGALPSNKLEKK